MRERRWFLIAREYGRSPAEVREWSDYDVERALMFMQAENPDQKFAEDDAKEAKARIPMAAKPGFILDLDYSHWQKFLTEAGELDAAKLEAGGYTEGQYEYVRDEMNKLGWLGGDAADTQPE